MFDLGRIQKELREIEKDTASGVTVQMKDNNLQRLTGYVPGPKDTPYEGGLFVVDIDMDNQYPFVPPKMRFVTKVWHPNVSSQNGAICLDILKDQWSPALTLKTALLSLQALLSSPEPDDPQDAVVAKQYISDRQTFRNTAKYWTDAFANPNSVTPEDKVQRLTEMGFARGAAISALQATGNDENAALEKLLSGC
jgi:ubiquitin-conjugating enzyme (huntingtin interacting protein 2)